MSKGSGTFSTPAPLVALAAWIIPGSGYWLIGQAFRGTVIGVTIIVLFIAGILIGGIRVVDVPGYDDRGMATYLNSAGQKVLRPEQGSWSLTSRPFSEIANKPWFVGQILAGPICVAAGRVSIAVSHPATATAGSSMIPRSHARIFEIGTLYTAVAGMLNLLAVIDSTYRAGQGAR